MRVFLDTNVLVSGFTARGLCADVIRLVLAEHEFITGEVVLMEVQRVLQGKLALPGELVDEILAFLHSHHVQAKPSTMPSVILRDKDDLSVLASALAANAEVLVTGDRDLLEVSAQVPGLRITDPRGFWNLIKKQGT